MTYSSTSDRKPHCEFASQRGCYAWLCMLGLRWTRCAVARFSCFLLMFALVVGVVWIAWGLSTDIVCSLRFEKQRSILGLALQRACWQDPKPAGDPKDLLTPKRAFAYLEKICAIGSRTTGTPGMRKQQEMLQSHFESLGGTILWQSFDVRHPETGLKVDVTNMVVQWKPELKERVMLCTHYDTKPFPANDPKDPKGLFVGANDGGSGVALLMELAHVMNDLPTRVGVDFVFFDAEELVYDENRDPFFLGSTYFAQAYANDPSGTRYHCAVLVDMIGDSDLHLMIEKYSMDYAKSIVEEVWGVAKKLRIKEFEHRMQGPIRDDHLPLNEIAKIPSIDIIDFDYARGRSRSYWHTTADTPDKCSGASLVKVGKVLVEWIKQQQ